MNESWPWMLDAATVDELVSRRAAATPESVAFIDEHDNLLTFGALDAKVDRVAAALFDLGIRAGSRVAWQLPTRISTAVTLLALRRLCTVQAPIITQYRDREVTAALRTFDADFFLTPGTWSGHDFTAMAARLDLPRLPETVEIGYEAPESDSVVPRPDCGTDDLAWVYFTSGSTGAPKGARHSDGTLLTTGYAFGGGGRLGEQPGEVAAMGFPIAHVGGVEYMIAALAAGFPILLLEGFVPDRAVELFDKYSVTTTGGAPPFYQALVAQARLAAPNKVLETLRTLKGGGAPCSEDLFYQVTDILGAALAHDYGMTEVPMVAVADPRDAPEILAGTDGRPIPGNELRIVDPDGRECPPLTPGEVQVSGSGVCRGYTDPDETAKAFTTDGWLRTGDIGMLHPTGHVEVVGRLKEMIIRKGENIAPVEIETALTKHPAVAEVAVIGLPDAERGEIVCAVIGLTPGVDAPSVEQLREYLIAAGLMRQKIPERVEIVPQLPRTGLAKVAKAELKRRYAPAVRG
ncbi:class I adenylate-forming enzyme family protein [Gordonia alkanivorans]|uniref:class I adenylate-forming enzyme family protein n=1 Tax=Gordonia alkanivorans TaxID=84096 RepID=UPI00244D6A8F|nr:class I adenylate-forming enzyme family protein [Gordonia alkanivorans]MDH3047239.1 class I adenylate-forming enzyme family protein [Gordonia alkanivorans]